jgi:hypothetical protein
MTKVRKRAMRAYLESNDKNGNPPRNSISQPLRLTNVGSTGSLSGNDSSDATTNRSSTISNSGSRLTPGSIPRPQTTQQAQHAFDQETHESSMDMLQHGIMKVTLIDPPRKGILPYDVQDPPLFVSFGEGVDPFRTMFQSSYPRVSVERMKFLCARFFGTKAMGMHWIPTVLSAPHTFLSTLCCASAHLDAVLERDIESVETSLLRQEVMHLISQGMVHPGQQADDLNVTSVVQLIVSEIIGREKNSLKIHEGGLERMIQVRGGLDKLGMKGYLASTCSWVLLESAILHEEAPRRTFVDYCTSRSTKRYASSAVLPESPLYRPRQKFDTLRNSRYYQKQTLALLDDIHSMIDLFLCSTPSSRRGSRNLQSYYRDITTKYPPVSTIPKPTKDHYKYEAIRITAILQATAIINRIPLSKALPLAAKLILGLVNTPAGSSRMVESPISPLSTVGLQRNSLSSSGLPSSYAEAISATPSDSYFDDLRTSIPSVTALHPSTIPSIQHRSFSSTATSNSSISSNISQPSLSSIATSNSSVSSNLGSYPLVKASRTRPSLLSTTSSPGENTLLFAEYIAGSELAGSEHAASMDALTYLKVILDASNLSEAWQDMAGVLLWIGLTLGAASHNVGHRVLEKWYSALSMRASTLLSFQYPEPIHSTMLKMTQIVEALPEPPSPGRADPTTARTGKRRRT